MSYHRFQDSEGHPIGSFEVFYQTGEEDLRPGDDVDIQTGWYWWACFPGCLPDGEMNGPFMTEDDAFNNAMEND